jgi:hypothetical protein
MTGAVAWSREALHQAIPLAKTPGLEVVRCREPASQLRNPLVKCVPRL